MSRTGKVAQLFNHCDDPRLAMHGDDMERLGLKDSDFAAVQSRRGEIMIRVAASAEMRPGQTFLPMHFGHRYLSHAGVNELMPSAVDPQSKQPELKHAAIQVEKLTLPFQALAMRTAIGDAAPQEAVLRWLERLQPLLSRFSYASLALAGRDQPAVVLRIAHQHALPVEWLAEIDALLDLPDAPCLAYRDARRNIDKKALIVDGKLAGLRLTGEIAAGNWLRETMVEGIRADELRRWIFAPLAAAPAAAKTRGRIICNCLDVAEQDIATAIAAGATLELLRTNLKCGTSCGSCLPELRRMLAAGARAA
jgi:assimilatory nitrate reductase catalytic subunit